MKYYLLVFWLGFVAWSFAQEKAITALPNAHAHNDYEHKRPLFDALRHGFTSIEADVHLIGGKLYVAHDSPSDLEQTPTLQSLYLDPLLRWVKQHNGQVYADYEAPILLMIDIKTKALPTYLALRDLLSGYKELLWYLENGKVNEGPVRIFLSGNRPIAEVQQESLKWVGIDGRPADLGKGYSPEFMPIISDNYRRHLSWRGKKGEPKAEEWAKLAAWVEQAHAEGKRVRLWASPENQAVWTKLREVGVDLLNTDKLEELRTFLLKEEASK